MPVTTPEGFKRAVRAGLVERHLFMQLDHSQGYIRYWTGIGPYTFQGNVYNGIGSILQLSGVSDSADVQNHDVSVSTNAIPLSAITNIDRSIRNKSFELFAVYIDATGNELYSVQLFSGLGNRITIKPRDTEYTLAASINSRLASWGMVGETYYIPTDQERLYPGDTGFSQVPLLQNSTISGWQRGVGSPATDLAYLMAQLNYHAFIGDASGIVMGHVTYGPFFIANSGLWVALDSNWYLLEVGTGNYASYSSVGSPLLAGGSNVSISGGGLLQSINANRIVDTALNAGSPGIRRQSAISTNGTQTGEQVSTTVISGVRYIRRSTGSAGAGNYSALLYPNNGLYRMSVSSSGFGTTGFGALSYRVDVSTAAGSAGYLVTQAYGANGNQEIVWYNGLLHLRSFAAGVFTFTQCRISTTGLVLVTSPLGETRVIPSNGDTGAFVRCWT
jgi:hypothetical protein